jgi:hypothetical protein
MQSEFQAKWEAMCWAEEWLPWFKSPPPDTHNQWQQWNLQFFARVSTLILQAFGTQWDPSAAPRAGKGPLSQLGPPNDLIISIMMNILPIIHSQQSYYKPTPTPTHCPGTQSPTWHTVTNSQSPPAGSGFEWH